MKEFIKNKWKILVFVLVLLVLSLVIYFVARRVSFSKKEYKGTYYKVVYDDSWKSKVSDGNLTLTHKKSKGTIEFHYKLLDNNLIDTNLEDIISDILTSLNEQNKDFKMISKVYNNEKYDSFQVLYEDDKDQCMINIYKQDNVLIIISYNNSNDYFDIVLDSVDSILDSIEIYSGER